MLNIFFQVCKIKNENQKVDKGKGKKKLTSKQFHILNVRLLKHEKDKVKLILNFIHNLKKLHMSSQ